MVRDERGSNLIEMALVTMFVLLPLMALTVDIGRVFHDYLIITNAAREGARLGARVPCNATNHALLQTAIQDAVIQEASNSGVTLAAGNVTILPDPVGDGCAAAGSAIDVTVTYTYATIMGSFVGHSTFTLTSKASMLVFGNDQL
jgi:Flp pilus assembly protein TadG